MIQMDPWCGHDKQLKSRVGESQISGLYEGPLTRLFFESSFYNSMELSGTLYTTRCTRA